MADTPPQMEYAVAYEERSASIWGPEWLPRLITFGLAWGDRGFAQQTARLNNEYWNAKSYPFQRNFVLVQRPHHDDQEWTPSGAVGG